MLCDRAAVVIVADQVIEADLSGVDAPQNSSALYMLFSLDVVKEGDS
jgi:hypothetical protein